MLKRQSAFTLYEIIIVIMMIAVVSVGLAISFGGTKTKVEFEAYETEIVNIMQVARGKSLANTLVGEDEETDYYLLDVNTDGMSLTAYGVDYGESGAADPIEISSFTLEDGYEINREFEVYYFPPYGELCFEVDCSGTSSSKQFRIDSPNSEYFTRYLLNLHGGYPEEL